jgi:myosin heavy subunit
VRQRYKASKIYTSIGDILISVNPFKHMDIYESTTLQKYKDRSALVKLEPHIFTTASRAYYSLVYDKENQSVIISGESGAGKTEATKLVLKFLSEVAGSDTGVEKQIMMSNPILEAFGNAKTLRNDNSSRFGKWMEVKFDKFGKIVGAKVVNYLLEKSRVVSQIQKERSYHAFYQLCAGASADFKKRFHIQEAQSYNYLNQSGCLTINNVDDAKDFNECLVALRDLKFTETDIEEIARVLSCILQLGNMKLTTPPEDADKTVIKDRDHLALVQSLIGLSAEDVETAICYRLVTIRNEVQRIKLRIDQATECRDSLAKSLYERLFDWLVLKINDFLCVTSSKISIGILDIFGFELFQVNSFEQFCINYANEQLQQHFIDHIFNMERNDYRAEKIDVEAVSFVDNQETLSLISGIIDKMDEEVLLVKGSDMSLIEKVNKDYTTGKNKNNYFGTPERLKPTEFTIKHYPGPVSYQVIGFLDKCRDTIHESLMNIVGKSSSPLVSTLFHRPAPPPEEEKKSSGGSSSTPSSPSMHAKKMSIESPVHARIGSKDSVDILSSGGSNPRGGSISRERKKKSQTIGSSFRTQLNDLMYELRRTIPSFVRCIKPNHAKLPDQFDSNLSLKQIKTGGLFEAIQVRASGYAYRKPHAMFYMRYRVLLSREDRQKAETDPDDMTRVRRILDSIPDLSANKKHVQLGITKIFYSTLFMEKLEEIREVKMKGFAILLQATVRSMFARRIAKKIKSIASKAHEALQSGEIKEMEEAIAKAENEKFEHPILLSLKSNYTEMVTQSAFFEKLKKVTKQKDYQLKVLNDLIVEADVMKLKDRYRKQEYLEAIVNIEMERDLMVNRKQTREKLEKSFATEDFPLLSEALNDASRFKLPQIEISKYVTLHSRLQKEIQIYDDLKSSVGQGMGNLQEVDNTEHCLSRTAEILKLSGDQNKFIKEVREQLLEFYRQRLHKYVDEKEEEQLQSLLLIVEKKGYAISLKVEIQKSQKFLEEQEKIRKALARQKYVEAL